MALCVLVEEIAPTFGAHVALTGGCLYKEGERKDIDILFYRIRQVRQIDVEGLKKALTLHLGLVIGERFGWVHKALHRGRMVDLFFPEDPTNTDGSGYEDAPSLSDLQPDYDLA